MKKWERRRRREVGVKIWRFRLDVVVESIIKVARVRVLLRWVPGDVALWVLETLLLIWEEEKRLD